MPVNRKSLIRGTLGAAMFTGTSKYLARPLVDIGDGRIAAMDQAGIDMQLLLLGAPGVQVFEPDTAVSLAPASRVTAGR